LSDIQLTTVIFIASGALSFLSAPFFSLIFIPIAKSIGAVDVPTDERRMHKTPVARIGGVAVFLSFLIGASVLSTLCRPFFTGDTATLIRAISIGGIVTVLGGLADDVYGLSPWQKILYQVLAALTAVACGVRLFDGALGIIGFIFWSVLLSNAFNLIDGLDGLSGGVAAFSLMSMLAISDGEPATLIILCSVLGFLPLNLRPAKLFLGDAGAMLLGFSLSVISARAFYNVQSPRVAISALLILFLPLFDTFSAVFRRVAKKKSPFSSDREHLHHRLVDAGLSHGRASLLLVMIAGGFSALGVTLFFTGFSFVSLILSSLLIFPSSFVIMMISEKIG